MTDIENNDSMMGDSEDQSKLDSSTAPDPSGDINALKKHNQALFANKVIDFNNNLLLKVNTMNLHKIVKGILVHNGYFFVKDVMKHFAKTKKKERRSDQVPSRYIQDPMQFQVVLDYEFELITDLKTDPKLDNEQVESIARELERLYDLYEKLMAMKPLEFSLSK